MEGAELDDVDSIEEFGPQGDGEGHHHQGDDLGEEDALEVVDIELLLSHDDEGCP